MAAAVAFLHQRTTAETVPSILAASAAGLAGCIAFTVPATVPGLMGPAVLGGLLGLLAARVMAARP